MAIGNGYFTTSDKNLRVPLTIRAIFYLYSLS